MNRLFSLILLTAGTLSGAAQPVVTGITPTSGSTAGGTIVVIRGSGFRAAPRVLFGGVSVAAHLIDANTVRATTPAHLPAAVNVSVFQDNGSSVSPEKFTFTGTIEDGFHRVLLPLFTPPLPGAFGSLFVTELRLANSSDDTESSLFGLTPVCPVTCLFDGLEQPYTIEPGGSHKPDRFDTTGRPGAFLYIPKSAPPLHANLRVYDQTRSALNFGTEIPVVYDHDFSTEPIKLLGVPVDPRFRNTLRIYAPAETTVEVAFDDIVQIVTLHAGENVLDPAYAQLSGISGRGATVDVTISLRQLQVLPIVPQVPFWAFISVTNNETQLISTITPQR